jgi:CheY-like chemotaxis protein
VWVESHLGLGSTFCAEIPIHFVQPIEEAQTVAESWSLDQRRLPILVVEDEAGTQLLYEKFLKATNFQHIPARTLQEAQQILERIQPKAIILDILMGNQDTWTWLARLKSEASTRQIPLLVVSQVDDPQKGLALGADAYGIKPIERHWLLEQLVRVTQPKERLSLLVIDDDPAVRYLLKKMLAQTSYRISEATDGREGIRLAHEALPQIILLDLILPVIDGFEVLEQLKSDPVTHSIPVIISTSKSLTVEEKQRLATHAQGLLTKDTLSEEVLLEALKDIFGTAYSDSQAEPETLVGNGHNK